MVSVTEFSKRIKTKYPEYKDVDDFELATRIVEKYPEYKDKVDLKKKDVVAPAQEKLSVTPSVTPTEKPVEPSPVTSPSESPLPSDKLKTTIEAGATVGGDKLNLPDGFQIDLRDPIGSFNRRANPKALQEYYSQWEKQAPGKLKALGQAPEKQLTEEEKTKQAGKQNDYKSVLEMYQTDPTYAISHLSKFTGKSPEELLTLTSAQIDELPQENETDVLSKQTLKRAKTAKRLADPSNWLNGKWSAERAAVTYASETDPEKAKFIRQFMQPVAIKKADGTEEKTVIYGDPKTIFKDSEGTLGALVFNYLNDPVNEAIAKNSPVAAEFEQAKKDFLKNYPKYAAASVGNKVSQAYEQSGKRGVFSRIAQMDTPGLRKELDETAKELVSKGQMTPEEYDVYINQVRGSDEFLDVPSLVESGAQGVEGVFSGIKKSFTQPFTPTSETQLKNWEEQITNVSANPKGLWNIANNAAHMVGFVVGMGAGGDILKGAEGFTQGVIGTTKALSPTVINMTNAGLVFFGDNLEAGKLKYPNDPAKAYASAGFNTALFMALAKDLFPVKQVQGAIRTAAPKVDAVVNELSTGAITKEAAKAQLRNIYTNTFQTLKNATGQNIKASSEMAGIALADRKFDELLGLDKDKYKQFHEPNAEYKAFANMFMGNLGVAGWAGYGKMRYKNRAVIEGYYDVAKRPDFYRKLVEGGDGTPEAKAEILENIKFIESLKQELDGFGMSESKQKGYIANALGQKALLGKTSADPTLQKKNEQDIKDIEADQEELLKNPEEEFDLEVPEEKVEVAPEVPQPTEAPAEGVVKINDVIDRTGTYKGQKGRFYLDGQQVIFDVEGSNKEYVIGSVGEIGDKSITEFGVEAEGKVVETNEAGNVVVRGEEFVNLFSDPTQAINRNKEGEVISVNLETADGKKRTFRGDVAKDIAAEIEQGRVAAPKVSEGEVPAEVAEGAPTVQPTEAPVEVPPAPQPKTIEQQKVEQDAETERLVGGQAEKNRKAGKYVKDGVEYVRNEAGQGEYSDRKGEVRFTNEVAVPFRYKLVEAETLQPSHSGGVRNPNHFIPEAQPKSRLDKGSIMAEEGFANNPRFEELGENTNAFSGAPVVNSRNEVVQGNNRAAGLKKGYERNNPAYKEALKGAATKFGFSPSQVEGMKNPVLVREVAVSDAGAVELGNYDVKDLETGGKRRLDPIAVTRRIPIDAKKRFAELLFGGDGTVNQNLRNNFDRVMEILKPLLNQAQRNTMMNTEGNLTEAGAKDIEAVGQQLLFDNGDPALPDLFENLSQTQKEGIRKSLTHIFAGGSDKNLVREVQNAILGLNDFAASGAKDLNQWMSQTDLLRDGKTPRDIYTPLELKMVEILNEAKSQAAIKEKFSAFENAIVDKEANMFEPAQKGKSKEEAVKEIFQPEDGEVAPEVPAAEKVEQLRAAEQAEYAAMADPNDKAKRKEIYDRYDKLITPLLEGKAEVPQPKEAPKELKEGDRVDLTLSTGGKVSGEKVTVPGYENMDFVAVRNKDGMNYDIYELASGRAIGAEAGTFFSPTEAANRVGEYLAANKVTPEKLFEKFIKREGDPTAGKFIMNESPAYENYKSQKQAEVEKKPFVHSESERKKLTEIADQAREKGLNSVADGILAAANSRQGKGTLTKLTEETAKQRIAAAEKNKNLKELQNQQKPLPEEDRKQRGDTQDDFKKTINDDYSRDQYEKLPQSIKNAAYEAFKKQVAIFNKYGYYPKYFAEAIDAQIATLKYIRATAARKVETRPERIKKAEQELIEAINFINQKHYEEFGGEKPTKVETIGARGGAEVGGEPKGEVPAAEGGAKPKGKYTQKAEQIAKEIMKAELPSWLKGAKLPPGTEKMGPSLPSEEAIKKALANAVIKMGKLLDKGVEFSQAVKEATKGLVKLMGEDKAKDIQNNFTDYYNQRNAIPKQTAGEVPVQPKAGAGEKMAGGTPGAEPKKPTEKGEGKGEKKEVTIERKKAFLNAIINAEGTPAAAKKGLEKQGLSYKTKNQKEAAQLADSIIKSQGIDAAVEFAEKETLDGDVNALIMMKSLENLADLEAASSSPADKQKYAIRFAEIAEAFDDKARSKGRFNSAINYFYKKSPLGVVINENNRRKQAFEDWASGNTITGERVEKSWEDFYDNIEDMLKDPEVAKVISERIAEGVAEGIEAAKPKAEGKVAESLRKFSAAIRKGRISKLGGFKSTTGFDAVWDASLEVFAKTLDAGATLADAVEAGLRYVKSTNWYANLTNKSEFENKYREHLNKEYEKDKKVQTYLDNLKQRLSGLSAKERDKVVKKVFTKIVESGGLDYQEFRDIIGEVVGRGPLTDAEVKKMKELVDKTNAIEDAAKRMQEERTPEAIKAYRIAQLEAAKASSELHEMLDTNPNISDRLTSIMQLNTLGIPALINNPIYNIWNQMTVRAPIGFVNTMVDLSMSKAFQAVGKNYVPETNILNAQVQAEFFKKLGLGLKESGQQFITGLNRQDYTTKDLTTQKIRPFESWKKLIRSLRGKEKLTSTQKIDRALQGTFGLPAEVVARILNLGDKPQRFAAEAATASMFARTLGLKDLDYQIFVEFPKEEAYRALKKQGLSEKQAIEKAEYIQNSIIQEGKRSTFQQDNLLNNMLNGIFSNKNFGGGANLIKSLAVSPYIKIPANAYWSYYNIKHPEVALLQSMVYGGMSAKNKMAGENVRSMKYAREARYWLGHAVVGMATRAVVLSLVQQGVFNPGTDKEETKKEREGKSAFVRQGTLDIDKLSAVLRGQNPDEVSGGTLIPIKYLGHLGMLGNSMAKDQEELTPEQKQARLTFWQTAFGFSSRLDNDLINEIQEGVFASTSALLSAFQDDSWQGWSRYGLSMMNLLTNIVQPATAAQVERALLPYQSTAKADNFMDELKNSYLQRMWALRYLTDNEPPAKIGVWGDRVEKKENFMMRWFGVSKENKDAFAYPIWGLYKKTGDIGYFPPAVLPRLNDQDLNVEQTRRLQEFIGQERKTRVAPFVNNISFIEGFDKGFIKRYMASKTGSEADDNKPVYFKDLDDDNKKFALNYLYDLGRIDGLYKFYLAYPELDPKNEYRNGLDEELKARRQAFREANYYKGRSKAQLQKMEEDRFKK